MAYLKLNGACKSEFCSALPLRLARAREIENDSLSYSYHGRKELVFARSIRIPVSYTHLTLPTIYSV